MKEYSRTQRVSEAIRRELGSIIQTEMKDPRVGVLSLTAVEVSGDLSFAKIYVSMLGDEEQILDAVKVLNKAAGFLRSSLAKNSQMRTVPRLQFLYDKSVTHGSALSDLIDKANESD